MQVTETLSEGLKHGFTIVVPGADIEAKRTARLTDLGRTLRLPGFRPGRVPLPVVRQRFGKAVTAEVLEESVNEATQKALTDRNLRPALTPKVDLVSIDTGVGAAQDLEFKVEFEALPQITLPDFKQIHLVRRKVTVPPEKVDEAVSDMARRVRTLEEITAEELAARTDPPGAAMGEVLTVDYVGKIDGEPFAGGSATDTAVDLVENSNFIPGFVEQIVGMKPGESRTISVTFPEAYGNAELAGKAATFDITAKKLSRSVIPSPEELATKLAFEDVAEMRKLFEQRQQRDYDALTRLRLKRELLDALTQYADFVVPQGMVEAEFGQIWQRLEAERKQGRLDEDDKDKDEATLRAEYRAIAERRVRLGLLLGEIGVANGISVTPEELNRAKRAEASRYPGQETQVMEFFRKNPGVEAGLRGPIYEEKVVDFVLELANVTEETVTLEELTAEPPAPAQISAPQAAAAAPEAPAPAAAAPEAPTPAAETVAEASADPAPAAASPMGENQS